MALNKSKGNMYTFVTHTMNFIKGECEHLCKYCYMKRFPQKPIRLDESEFKTDLGKGNFIFVGSSCDMFADGIPEEWIIKVLDYCKKFDNKYLFQTKNPKRLHQLRKKLPKKVVLGTTIESNRHYPEMGKAPLVQERAQYMHLLANDFETMVTVEPIIDFDLGELIDLVEACHPAWVNIGADSNNHNLSEPNKITIELLRDCLKEFTEVKLKDNLARLMKS